MPEPFDFKAFAQRFIEFASRRQLRDEQNGEIAEKKRLRITRTLQLTCAKQLVWLQ